ncbi:14529_t:CDS:2, partial [Entrophospora sp. SA101]
SDQETLDNYFQQENDDIYEISSITPELSNNKRKHARWDRAYPSRLEIHLAN